MYDDFCKAMCSSLSLYIADSSCVGYAYEPHAWASYCEVYGSMASAPYSWSYTPYPATTISGSDGALGYSCYLKNEGTIFVYGVFRKKYHHEKNKKGCSKCVSPIYAVLIFIHA